MSEDFKHDSVPTLLGSDKGDGGAKPVDIATTIPIEQAAPRGETTAGTANGDLAGSSAVADTVVPAGTQRQAPPVVAPPPPGEPGAATIAAGLVAAPPATEDLSAYVYDALTLPEHVKPADPEFSRFSELAREARIPPDKAQALVDLYSENAKRFVEESIRSQHQAFADIRKAWRDEVMGDPVIGGSGHVTAMNRIALVRDNFASDVRPSANLSDADKTHRQADLEEFNKFVNTTGVGDHPVFLRLLHRVSNYLTEPAPSPVTGKPAADKSPSRRLRDVYK